MKKILSLLAATVISAASFAQIAVWNTAKYTPWNNETQRYDEKYDSSSTVGYMFKYSWVDSIRVEKRNGEDMLIFYQNNGVNGELPLRNYSHWDGGEQHGIYDCTTTIDSIVWQPYKTTDISDTWEYNNHIYHDTIIMPLRTYRSYAEPNGEFRYSNLAVPRPVPIYAAVENYSYEVEDKSICDVKANFKYSFDKQNQGLGYNTSGYGMSIDIYPYAEGETKLKVNIDGCTREFTIIILPREGLPEPTEETDQLFSKIYSRMVETGDCHPNGCSDITGYEEYSAIPRFLSYLNDMSADQVYWVWRDGGIDKLRNNTWTADNELLSSAFHRLYYNIYLCNSYLSRKDATDPVRSAEVRFIRAYMYYQLLDLFGNVPIVTNNADFYTAPQVSRAELYDFVVSELLEAEQSLAAQKTDYYQVDKTAAWLLLSRVYLNSEVYAGKSDFTKAAQYAYKILQANYSLCENYRYLFMGDNDTNGAQNEIIWALRQVGSEHSTYGGSQYFVAAFADGNEDVGSTTKWACANTRARLLQLFTSNYTLITLITGTYQTIPSSMGDDRALFSKSNVWQSYGDNRAGWTIHKWTNERSDGQTGTDPAWSDTDIPLFRLAEAYLNYAEAVMRGGNQQGDLTALDAVNAVRLRAHATELSSMTLDNILDERGREFYAEGMRRPDLIRFGKFGGNTGYQWDFKGGSNAGADFPEYMNLYPIPADLLQVMPQGVQNNGY